MLYRLEKLSPLVKKRKRIGRGGSRGGTSGKGHKGQKARSGGYVSPIFEGGQMPLTRRLPKRGFKNYTRKEYVCVNIQQIEDLFSQGELVTKQTLVEKGLIKAERSKKGMSFLLKVLGDGALSKKVTVQAHAFSKTALKAIQDCGGQASIIEEI